MTTLYAFSALVMPAAVAADEPLDLHQFHAREGRRYIMAHNLFAGVAALAVAILGGVGRASAAFLLPSTRTVPRSRRPPSTRNEVIGQHPF